MRQTLELALDWIKKQPEKTPESKYDLDTRYVVLRELEAALAQPEQKPLLLIQSHRDGYWCNDLTCKKCYAADFRFKHTPPQQTWVDLTDDEMLMIYGQKHEGKKYSLGRMVQAKLKDKNT